jgi:predicted hydrocarbon binding protein
VPTLTAVAALIPLSLFEAIRNLDTPVEDGLDELAEEIVVRRLGLSPTVAAQIQRYRQAAERAGSVEVDEAISVLRLVGRRPDAPLVFADAGRRAARHAARRRGRSAHTLAWVTPTGIGQRIALRNAARVARRVFGAELQAGADGLGSEVRMSDPLSISALPDGAACAFYGAAYNELLRSLTGFEGAMEHLRCRGRGDNECVWQAAPVEMYE